ncbi:MAG: YhbY family RNA-binding protein [archaeon]
METQAKAQIGKNGLTEGLIELLKNSFKNHDSVRISLLKTSTRDRKAAVEIAEKISSKLGKKYTYKIMGFTICLKKWRKAPFSKSRKPKLKAP